MATIFFGLRDAMLYCCLQLIATFYLRTWAK